MEWIISNWFLLFVLALCLGMHFLGGHGHHGRQNEQESTDHKGDLSQKRQRSCH
jgi:hypothetical protein